MGGKFMKSADVTPDVLDWARLGWLSNPKATGAERLTVIRGDFFPGKGHAFYYHADQDEVIYVLAGSVEQWIEREKQILGPGDCAYIPAGVVHASYNAGAEDATVLAILSPCVGEMGVDTVDVSGEAPWNTLRTSTSQGRAA